MTKEQEPEILTAYFGRSCTHCGHYIHVGMSHYPLPGVAGVDCEGCTPCDRVAALKSKEPSNE